MKKSPVLPFVLVLAAIAGVLYYSHTHRGDPGIDNFAALAQALLSALALFVLAYDLHSQGKTIAEQQQQLADQVAELKRLSAATSALVRTQAPFLRLELSDDGKDRIYFRLANRGGGTAFLHGLSFEVNGKTGQNIAEVVQDAARHLQWLRYDVAGQNHAPESVHPGKWWDALALSVPPQLVEGRERTAREEFLRLVQLMQVRVTLSGVAADEAVVVAEPVWVHPQREL